MQNDQMAARYEYKVQSIEDLVYLRTTGRLAVHAQESNDRPTMPLSHP